MLIPVAYAWGLVWQELSEFSSGETSGDFFYALT